MWPGLSIVSALLHEPLAHGMLVAFGLSVLAAGFVIRRALRHERSLTLLRAQLEQQPGSASLSPERSGWLAVLAAASAVALPLLLVVMVVRDRARFIQCLTADGDWTCEFDVAYDVFSHPGIIGLGAIMWLALLPLAAMALGMILAQHRRRKRLGEIVALDRNELTEEGDYRTSGRASIHALRDWLLRHPAPSIKRTVVWMLLATVVTAGMFASGVARSILVLSEHSLRFPPRGKDPIITRAYDLVTTHSMLALVGLVLALVTAVIWLRVPQPPRHLHLYLARGRSRWGWPQLLLGPAAGLMLMAIAQPMRAQNEHPATPLAQIGNRPFKDLALPKGTGPFEDIEDMPTLEIEPSSRARLDGRPGDDAELQELLTRKHELWSTFYPDKPHPGAVLLAVDRTLADIELITWLQRIRAAGYSKVFFVTRVVEPLDPPLLGVWRTVNHDYYVPVELAAKTINGAPLPRQVGPLVRRAVECYRDGGVLVLDPSAGQRCRTR